MGLKFMGVTKRVGDGLPEGHTLVMRVVMSPEGWSVDLNAAFEEMLGKYEGREEVGESLIEAVTRTIRMHTGKVG